MTENTRKSNPPEMLNAPAFPLIGPQLFQRLRTTLADVFGFEPRFDRLAQVLGEKTNKVHYWFKVHPNTQVIAFLSLLERLPDRKRLDLLNLCCRELPSLDSSRLAHVPLAVSNLENLLRRTTGVTLIRGGPEFQRTFLIAAMGHSFPRIGDRARPSMVSICTNPRNGCRWNSSYISGNRCIPPEPKN